MYREAPLPYEEGQLCLLKNVTPHPSSSQDEHACGGTVCLADPSVLHVEREREEGVERVITVVVTVHDKNVTNANS